MKKLVVAAATAAALWCTPVHAQRSYELGPMWKFEMIDVEAGQLQNYMTFLDGQWKANQQFAKQQGWFLDYHILLNENKRPGEPDLYLVSRYADNPSNAELKRRDAVMLQRMQRTPQALDQESAARVNMRTQMGSMLLRELVQK
jgi:hypothetical protein